MASVKKRKRKVGVDKDGKPIYKDAGWQVRYVDPTRRERLKVFKTQAEAKAFAAKVETQKNEGTFIDPSAGLVTFRDYAEAWRVSRPHREATRDQVKSRLENHLYPTLGPIALRALRPTVLQAWVTERAATDMSQASLELIVGYARSILKAAVADRVIPVSPAASLMLPSFEDDEPVVPYTLAEWRAIEAAMPERWAEAVPLAIGSGLRQGELRGLTVDRVDWFRKEIRVDRQATAKRVGDPPRFGPPKTKKSRRTIPVPQRVLDGLAAHLAEFPAGQEGLIFTTDRGGMIVRSAFSAVVKDACVAAGITDGRRFHALRHTYASMLIRGGCSVKVVQERLGHASAQETLETYAHMWPDDDDRTREAVDQGFAEGASDPDRTGEAEQ